MTILAIYNPNIGTAIDPNNWFHVEGYSLDNYWQVILIMVIVCFLGALVPFPIPYVLPVSVYGLYIFTNAANPWPMIVGLIFISALGNTIGDSIDYLIGNGAQHLMKNEDPGQLDRWGKLILQKPKYIPTVIFLFGLTPLPDSLLLVPLGMVKYSFKKAVVFMYLGKVGLLTIAVFGWIGGNIWLIGLIGGESGWVSGMVLLYGVWLIMTIMLKVKINPSTKG